MNREQIDAGFDQARSERLLRANWTKANDPEFWRALNPHLTISEGPMASAPERVRVDPLVVARAARQIVDEGYLLTPPLVPPARIEALRRGVLRIVETGLPAGLLCVYDEFYQAFHGLEELFVPLLGERYLMVMQGLWTYFVAAGDPGYGNWTAGAPHRDRIGPDTRVIAHEVPAIINVWIPLTDVSPIDSCIYAIPAPGDSDYYTAERRIRPEAVRLQDVRALPAPAGSVLGWSTHLAHWGSRSSRFATGPRVSVTVYLQRRDSPVVHPATVELDAPMPFRARLEWIWSSLGVADREERGGDE